MPRPAVLIVGRDPGLVASLRRFLSLFTPTNEFPHRVLKVSYEVDEQAIEALDRLPPQLLRDLVVLVAGTGNEQPWSLGQGTIDGISVGEGVGLAASICLRYPEVWVVAVTSNPNTARPWNAPAPEPDSGNPGRSAGTRPGDPAIVNRYHDVAITQLARLIPILGWHAMGFRTWFDPTGLRTHLKTTIQSVERARHEGAVGDLMYQPVNDERRRRAAVVMDEEAPFRTMNAYTAFRGGRRTWIASSESEFRRLLSPNADVATVPVFEVAISDWDLRYGDAALGSLKTEERVSGLGPRSLLVDPDACSFDRFEKLVIVTTNRGEIDSWQLPDSPREVKLREDAIRSWRTRRLEGARRSGAAESEEDVAASVAELESREAASRSVAVKNFQDKKAEIVPKPYPGIFSLHTRITPVLDGQLLAPSPRSKWTKRFGVVAKRETGSGAPSSPQGHSAPFANQEIAGALVSRARSSLAADGSQDTEALIHCALLALEAKELLGGMSLTTTFEALDLQHQAEVRAELSCMGVAGKFEMKPRLSDLDREASGLVRRGSGTENVTHDERRNNFLLRASSRLRLTLADHEEVEASEDVLVAMSVYRRALEYTNILREPASAATARLLQWPGRAWRIAKKFVLWLSRAYIDRATNCGTSAILPVLFGTLWIVFFGVLFGLLLCDAAARGCIDEPVGLPLVLRGIDHALLTFIEMQPGRQSVETACCNDAAYRYLLVAELGVAYIHLGLFIAVLYRRVTKRAP